MIVDKFKQIQSQSALLDTDRYRNLYNLVDEDGVSYKETPDKISIPESITDVYFVVDPEFEDRLDLVSFKFYNTPLLWWVIAECSGIYNPLELPVGTILRIPSKSTLYGFKGVLSK